MASTCRLCIVAHIISASVCVQAAAEHHLLQPRDGKVLHCAGQSDEAFQNYWQFMGQTGAANLSSPGLSQPAMYMVYYGLDKINETAPGAIAARFIEWKQNLSRYDPAAFVIPQFGLSFTHSGKGYGAAVANGEYDHAIETLARSLKYLERPVLMRLGYEFNGAPWNGYQPHSYVAAWKHVVPMLRSMGVNETAMVWDATCDHAIDHPGKESAFYPGDELVDWWGVNIFSDGSSPGNKGCVRALIDNGGEAGYPVLLGESTPRHVGAGAPYSDWFEPYQELIQLPAVQAACYIDWNWASTTRWPDWGDCRVEEYPKVTGDAWRRFVGNSSLMLGAMPRSLLREELGLPP